jgi:DNA-binding transcriptional LysR family regulator
MAGRRRVTRNAGSPSVSPRHTLRHALITAALDATALARRARSNEPRQPRTTTRYDRGYQSRDRHATPIVATFIIVDEVFVAPDPAVIGPDATRSGWRTAGVTRLNHVATRSEVELLDRVAAGYGLFLAPHRLAGRNARPDLIAREFCWSTEPLVVYEHLQWRHDDDDPVVRLFVELATTSLLP